LIKKIGKDKGFSHTAVEEEFNSRFALMSRWEGRVPFQLRDLDREYDDGSDAPNEEFGKDISRESPTIPQRWIPSM